MIELRHLRTLVALRQAGNLTRAAAAVNLTQSALSQQIRLLETLCNGPLFERKSTPLIFTAIGDRLLRLADTVLPKLEEAMRDIARLTSETTGTLRVAIDSTSYFPLLLQVGAIFRKQWPEVDLDTAITFFHIPPLDLLRRRMAELALVSKPEPEPGIVYSPLFQFELVAVLPRNHPLVFEPFLKPEHFVDEVLITNPTDEEKFGFLSGLLEETGSLPATRPAEQVAAMMQLAANDHGISVMPFYAVKAFLEDYPSVIVKPITEKKLIGKVYGAARADIAERAYVASYLNLIRSYAVENLAEIQLL